MAGSPHFDGDFPAARVFYGLSGSGDSGLFDIVRATQPIRQTRGSRVLPFRMESKMGKATKIQNESAVSWADVIGDSILSYGEGEETIALRVSDMRPGNVVALLQRQYNHVMGNELSSAIGTAKEKAEGKGESFDAGEFRAEWVAEKLEYLRTGDINVRAGGTRPETFLRNAAESFVKLTRKAGTKVPTGDAMKAAVAAALADPESRAKIERAAESAKAFAEQQAALLKM